MAAQRKNTQIYLTNITGISGTNDIDTISFEVHFKISKEDFDRLNILELGNISITKFKDILRCATYGKKKSICKRSER